MGREELDHYISWPLSSLLQHTRCQERGRTFKGSGRTSEVVTAWNKEFDCELSLDNRFCRVDVESIGD